MLVRRVWKSAIRLGERAHLTWRWVWLALLVLVAVPLAAFWLIPSRYYKIRACMSLEDVQQLLGPPTGVTIMVDSDAPMNGVVEELGQVQSIIPSTVVIGFHETGERSPSHTTLVVTWTGATWTEGFSHINVQFQDGRVVRKSRTLAWRDATTRLRNSLGF
jgi:hypothetical protein